MVNRRDVFITLIEVIMLGLDEAIKNALPDLTEEQKERLAEVLEKHKQAK